MPQVRKIGTYIQNGKNSHKPMIVPYVKWHKYLIVGNTDQKSKLLPLILQKGNQVDKFVT